MSVTKEVARRILETEYRDSNLNPKIVDLIMRFEGRQYFIEEVEEQANVFHVFAIRIKIFVVGNGYSRIDIPDFFSDVPLEHKVDAVPIGDIEAYYESPIDSTTPEDRMSTRKLGTGWYGSLLIGVDESLWVFVDDYMYLIAPSFNDFILLSPKNHCRLEYLLKF